MAEGPWIPTPDLQRYTCGRCGYSFATTSRDEYRKLYVAHAGAACLAIINQLTPDQIRYLCNDLLRISGHGNTVKQLIGFLEQLADEWERNYTWPGDSPAEGPAGESGE